jgi:hypothetical protein
MHFLLAAIFLTAALHTSTASAQSLNCGGGLFGVGDSKLLVMQRCGEPLSKEVICVLRPEVIWVPSNYPGAPAQQIMTQQCVPMEDWTYYRGQGNFMSIARFYNGTIESARDGQRAP